MINPNYCPACGNKVTPGDAFCGKCGNPLGGKNPEESVVVEEKHEEEPRRPRRPLLPGRRTTGRPPSGPGAPPAGRARTGGF